MVGATGSSVASAYSSCNEVPFRSVREREYVSLRLYPPLSRKPIRPSAARPACRPSTRNVSSSPPAIASLLPSTSRASGVVMLITPLKALAP